MLYLGMAVKKLTFILYALEALVHRVICGAGKNIKACIYCRLANCPRRVENRIARIFKFASAQNGFLMENGAEDYSSFYKNIKADISAADIAVIIVL